MSFEHLLKETCFVEKAVKQDDVVVLDGDGETTYTGIVVPLKCMHLRKQRTFKTQGSEGNAGERISEHEVVTSIFIDEEDRVWIPGKNQTKVNQSLIPKGLESMSRPYGGLTLYRTFL